MGGLSMSNNFKISVNELVAIFRGALLAIIPWIEKAKIKWKEGEAYDDWDNIAESLYNNIVCSSLTGNVASEYEIAKYNFYYDDYATTSFILVRSKNNPEKRFAFVHFQSNSSPMDTVKVAELDKKDNVIGYVDLKFCDSSFIFVRNINGRKKIIDRIEVLL
jgi:hypothetical protein